MSADEGAAGISANETSEARQSPKRSKGKNAPEPKTPKAVASDQVIGESSSSSIPESAESDSLQIRERFAACAAQGSSRSMNHKQMASDQKANGQALEPAPSDETGPEHGHPEHEGDSDARHIAPVGGVKICQDIIGRKRKRKKEKRNRSLLGRFLTLIGLKKKGGHKKMAKSKGKDKGKDKGKK